MTKDRAHNSTKIQKTLNLNLNRFEVHTKSAIHLYRLTKLVKSRKKGKTKVDKCTDITPVLWCAHGVRRIHFLFSLFFRCKITNLLTQGKEESFVD